MRNFLLGVVALLSCGTGYGAATEAQAPDDASDTIVADPKASRSNRVASMSISQDFINEQLSKHSKSTLLQKLQVTLDTKNAQILLRGIVQVPEEELRAVNLDPALGAFRFQLAVKPETTAKGHLILEFPLAETYFYPANSTNPKADRVIVPVQMLSLALASTRGYLAALSGDFSGFDRRTRTLNLTLKDIEAELAKEKRPEFRDRLETDRESVRLQLEAVPIERKQLLSVAKELEHILGFTGEKELNLNDELGARKNALILKLRISQLAPYLKGVELGGIRFVHDKKDGVGEDYLAVDINSELVTPPVKDVAARHGQPRPGMHTAPSLIMRLKQSLFQSEAVIAEEKKAMPSSLRHFDVQFHDDGMHISGAWRTLLFFSIPFETVVDFVTTGVDSFEVRVQDIEVAGIDVEFLANWVLETVKKRLDQTLKGMCTFELVEGGKGKTPSLKVRVDPKKLVPAFPDLHLVAVNVRDKEFLLKIGRP